MQSNQVLTADEAAKWKSLEATAAAAFAFWKTFFKLKRSPSNDQELTAADIAAFKTIIRCVSWVESRHGTGVGNFPAVDPMQCGNPADAWWKAINKPAGTMEDRFIDSSGKGYWAAELPGVMAAASGFPAAAKLTYLSKPADGHKDSKYNSTMSFYWGVLYLIQKVNTGVAGGKTYKCGDCSKARMVDGARNYNGTGDATYETKILEAWAMITGEPALEFNPYSCLSDEFYVTKQTGGKKLFTRRAEKLDAEVLIQAGHFNHNPWDDRTGAATKYGVEIEWTPVVRDSAVEILQKAGITVISTDASIKTRKNDPPSMFQKFRVNAAAFIHFDGSKSGSAGASVGYNDDSDKPAAAAWRELYSRYWDFRWMSDNYTDNLRYYYGYAHTVTTDSEILIEFGDLSNKTQALWLKSRLKQLGHILAHFLASRVGKGSLILPPSDEDLMLL